MKPTKEKPIIKLSSRVAYQNPWITVREDTTLRKSGESIHGVVEVKDSVIVCAINAKDEIYLIYGYSYPTDVWSWQIPGGGDDGEEPVVAAERELLEEAGLRAGYLKDLGSLIVCCGVLTERMSVVVATDLKADNEQRETDDSDVIDGGKFVHIDEVRSMVDRGEICDSQSISGLYMLDRWLLRRGEG